MIKTDAANINPKMLDSRDRASLSQSVNITRSHDGDILIIKGKFDVFFYLSFVNRDHSDVTKRFQTFPGFASFLLRIYFLAEIF